MKKITKWFIGILLTFLIIISVTFIIVKNKEYQPSTSALSVAKTSQNINGTTKFSGDDSKPMVIFYPGALVEPKSYSIWAKRVANAGYSVYIVRFPLDMAVLNSNAANKIQKNKAYIIGGHSLGGTMASRYAHNHPDKLKGVFFLASYPEKKGNLRKTTTPVLSVTATNDGVLQRNNYQQAKRFLPSNTTYKQIEGGNHAGFGSYGKQRKDNPATISNYQQQIEISHLLINWLSKNINQ